MVEADGRNAATVERLFSRAPLLRRAGLRGEAAEHLAAGRQRALRLPRWRRRSGLAVRFHTMRYYGATPRWRSARGRPPAADEHARPVESVEGRREATALRRSRQETLSRSVHGIERE